MTEQEKERFEALCAQERGSTPCPGTGIGTYGEKRLHRILKNWICAEAACQEVPIGTYVADVVTGAGITEIQTGSFRPLLPKLRYYLSQTDYPITVLHPVIAEKTVIRVERESGEVVRKRRSPAHGRIEDVLPQLYWISEVLTSPRLTVRVLLIGAEEIRYSERMRYRRAGRYEAELFPGQYFGETVLSGQAAYRIFLPEASEFDAEAYRTYCRLAPRAANAALQTLCAIGLLERQKVGRKYLYRKTEQGIGSCADGYIN